MAKMNTGARLLQRFLAKNELTGADLARALKVHRAQAGRWLSATFVPRKWAQQGIATWTNGAVPVESWPAKRIRGQRRTKVVPYRDTNAQRVEVSQ